MSEAATRPVAGRRLVLAACMTAMFMTAIEATIVATAMPTIVAQLGGFALFGWVFAAYLLTQAVTIPIYGRLADLYGRKRVFYFGASLFLTGSTLCGFSHSMLMLVLFRALQGLGAGALLPVASTIVGDIYAPAERAKMQGYLSSIWGFSAIVGPVLGAFIIEHLSWSLIFWINVPIGLATMAMLAAFLHEERHHRAHVIDYAGAGLMVLAVGVLMLALLQADQLGWWMLPLLGVSALGFRLLLVQERRAPEPLLPLGLWRNRTILAGNVGGLAIGASMMGISAFLPTYVQAVMGRDVGQAGLVLALMSVSWSTASGLSGRLMLVTSYRTTAVIGGAVLAIGSIGLLMLTPARGMRLAEVASVLVGIGMGMSSSTFLVAVQSAAHASARGIATASAVFTRMLGSALGTAVLASVLNLGLAGVSQGGGDPVQTLMDAGARAALSRDRVAALVDAVAAGMHLVFVGAAVLAGVAFCVAWMVPAGLRPGHAAEGQASGR